MTTLQFIIILILFVVLIYKMSRPHVVHDTETFYESAPQGPVDLTNLEVWLKDEIKNRGAVANSFMEATAIMGQEKFRVIETAEDGRIYIEVKEEAPIIPRYTSADIVDLEPDDPSWMPASFENISH